MCIPRTEVAEGNEAAALRFVWYDGRRSPAAAQLPCGNYATLIVIKMYACEMNANCLLRCFTACNPTRLVRHVLCKSKSTAHVKCTSPECVCIQ